MLRHLSGIPNIARRLKPRATNTKPPLRQAQGKLFGGSLGEENGYLQVARAGGPGNRSLRIYPPGDLRLRLPAYGRTLGMVWNWTPILMFHEVFPDGTHPLPPYSITRSGLRAVLSDFISRGYTAGTLEDVIAGQEDGMVATRRSGKRVVLTFDDGTRDFVDNALPVLQELNFSATLFIVAGMIGGERAWNALPGQRPLAQVPLLDASELRALHAQGFTIGSHSMSHPQMSRLSDEEALRELARSRTVLSDMIGQPVRWFAYPYLAANERTKRLAREAGYAGACGGPNQPHTRYYLSRVDGTGYSLAQLRLRTNGLYHLARQTFRRVKYGWNP